MEASWWFAALLKATSAAKLRRINGIRHAMDLINTLKDSLFPFIDDYETEEATLIHNKLP